MEKRCSYCDKIIIKDYAEFIKKQMNEKEKVIEIECPYCRNVEVLNG